jgi:hypothetical protein
MKYLVVYMYYIGVAGEVGLEELKNKQGTKPLENETIHVFPSVKDATCLYATMHNL